METGRASGLSLSVAMRWATRHMVPGGYAGDAGDAWDYEPSPGADSGTSSPTDSRTTSAGDLSDRRPRQLG